jgi:hypothetical protein
MLKSPYAIALVETMILLGAKLLIYDFWQVFLATYYETMEGFGAVKMVQLTCKDDICFFEYNSSGFLKISSIGILFPDHTF